MLVPCMPSEEQIAPYLKRIHQNRVYSNFGPLNAELESRLAQYFSVDENNVVTVSSATLGLQSIVAFFNHFNEWASPSWSFTATGLAVLQRGKKLRFVDVDAEWRARFENVNEEIGLIDVAPFGDAVRFIHPNDCSRKTLIDAAASFDALRNIGEDNSMSGTPIVVSMHATKLLGAGEGGVVISKDKRLIDFIRNWSSFGFKRGERNSLIIGTNAKLSEFSAAVALASFDAWAVNRSSYLELLDWARSVSMKAELQVQPSMEKGLVSPYWIVKTTPERLESLKNLFRDSQIQTRQWWGYGMHDMPVFRGIARSGLESTDKLARQTLGLPFHLDLSDENKAEIEDILLRSC